MRLIILFLWTTLSCNGFIPIKPCRKLCIARTDILEESASTSTYHDDAGSNSKTNFLNTLDKPYDLNAHNELRTNLLNRLVESKSGISNPGSAVSFASVAPGTWRVIYAPHMTIIADLVRGELSVQYDLVQDRTMTSHARYSIPMFRLFGYLSISGVYGSVNDIVCRVDFDEAWLRTFDDHSKFGEGPYPDITKVPNSIWKSLIRKIGQALFIEPLAVFPISYLDDDLIIFDFELLGTRICARKENQQIILGN